MSGLDSPNGLPSDKELGIEVFVDETESVQYVLADTVAKLEANQCTNPLRSEIPCASLVRDNDVLREQVAKLKAENARMRQALQTPICSVCQSSLETSLP